MKVLSLFDGISVARVALERAGFKVEKYFASEIDKYAIQIALKNYPDTIEVGDITQLKGEDFKDIDLIIGGSPCQDLSIAKKNREGLSGSRSGLFWEHVRLLNEIKPKLFILENVNSMPKEAKQTITETLGVEPIMINAALVSAQNRKRLFWVGRLVGDKYEKVEIQQPEDRGILLRDILEENVDEKFYVKDKSNTIRTSGRGSGINDKHNWDTIRIGQLNKGGQGERIYDPQGKSVNLSALGGGRGAKTGLYKVKKTLNGYQTNDSVPEIGQAKRKYHKDGKIPPLNNWSPLFENEEYRIRKLTPIECERLQSLGDNYTEGVSNSQRYKMLGNAFNCEVVCHILSFIK